MVQTDNIPEIPQPIEPVLEAEQPELVPSNDFSASEPPVEPEKPVIDLTADMEPSTAEADEPTTPIQAVQYEDVMAQVEEEEALTIGGGSGEVKTDHEPPQEIDLLGGPLENRTPQDVDLLGGLPEDHAPQDVDLLGGLSEDRAPQEVDLLGGVPDDHTPQDIDLLAGPPEDHPPQEIDLLAGPSEDRTEPEEPEPEGVSEEQLPLTEPAEAEKLEEVEDKGEGEEMTEAVSRDDEEWVMVDTSVPPTEELISAEAASVTEPTRQEEDEEEEIPANETEEAAEVEREEGEPFPAIQEPLEEPEEEVSTPTPEHRPVVKEEEEEEPTEPFESEEQEEPDVQTGTEPLSPYYEVPVPSQKPGIEVTAPPEPEPVTDQFDNSAAQFGDAPEPVESVTGQFDNSATQFGDAPLEPEPVEPVADQFGNSAIQFGDEPAEPPREEEEVEPEEVAMSTYTDEQDSQEDKLDYQDRQESAVDRDEREEEVDQDEREMEVEQLGSSFIPINVLEADARSETSSTAAPPTTPPLSMVVERGSPVTELTEPSVTSQDDEQEDRVTEEEGEPTMEREEEEEERDEEGEREGPPERESEAEEVGEETVDDAQEEEIPGEASDGVMEPMEEAEPGDMEEEEEVVDDVQEELHTTGDEEMTRTAEGTEDDGAAGEEGEDGDEGEGEEREEEEEEVGDEEPLPGDDDGSLPTPIQLQSDPPQESLLDFDPMGGASAGPPPQSDPFGMDPLELVTTPPHKAANDIFGQDPFGAAAASASDQSYNPFAPAAELDPFSVGGQEFETTGGPPAAAGGLLLGDPLLPLEGGLRPEGDADLRDSGVQSPELQGDQDGVPNWGGPDFGGQGIEGGVAFESSADPPSDDLGTPVD